MLEVRRNLYKFELPKSVDPFFLNLGYEDRPENNYMGRLVS
jgi:hypothetical protein